MEPDYEYMDPYGRRYMQMANRLAQAGERERADAYAALASAFQLFPPHHEKPAVRGQYFGPMATGSFGEIPSMAFVREPRTVAFLKSRINRIRDPLRRARVADTVWEFAAQPDPEAARQAIDGYLTVGARQLRGTSEFAAMSGSGALGRALQLALAINDKERIRKAVDTITQGIRYLADRHTQEEHVPLFRLVEALLMIRDKELDTAAATEALQRHRDALEALDDDVFHFIQGIIELQIRLARRVGDDERAERLERELGESYASEGAWKQVHYSNGALIAMHFYAKAAAHFEGLGDRKRADELHARERAAFGGATFHELRAEVQVSAAPFEEWLTRVLTNDERKVAMWPAVLEALPVPTLAAIEEQRRKADDGAPILALMGTSTVRPEGVLEYVTAEEASRQRAARFAYEQHGLNVALLVRLAREKHQATPTDALPAFRSTAFFDETSEELLTKVLAAIANEEWLSAGYLAGPLIERLVRARVSKIGGDVMYTDRGGGKPRRLRKPLEQLLDALPLRPDLLAYVRWVVAHPGLNLRNEAGHGLLEKGQSHEVLGAHILYTILALSFGDLELVEHVEATTAE